ncbi:MAG: hypothetical protein RL450_612 [Actinomycetota bacterium]|jgi:hypothetical protein
MSKPKSTRRALSAIVLSFESIVVFFATLTAFGLRVGPVEWVWGIGLTVSILMILTPAILGRPGGYALGWILQAALLVSGFWLWGMFVIGSILVGMWIWAQIAGGTVDRARENYLKLKENND